MTVSVSTPLRIDLTGGYTDVPEIYAHTGGVGLNIAITLRTHVLLTPGPDRGAVAGPPDFPHLVLLHASRILGVDRQGALDVRSDGPRGCGLGSSAGVAVAVVSALHPTSSLSEIVEVAHRAEVAAGNSCGMQDQIASAFGGVNAMDFPAAGPYSRQSVEPIDLAAIEASASLWLKPGPRSSGTLVDELLADLRGGDRAARSSLGRLNRVYPALLDSVRASDLPALIAAVREVHAAQVALHDLVVPRDARTLVQAIEERWGGAAKLQGGGGAGSALLAIVPGGVPPGLETLMVQAGYRRLPLGFDARGLVVD